MKLLFILMALPVLASTCKKNRDTAKDDYLRGKVIRNSCADLVIQVLNDDTVGEDGWKDVTNKNTVYDNVFSATNSCKLGDAAKVGNILKFKIAQPGASGCMFCQLYDAAPKAQFDMLDVSVEK